MEISLNVRCAIKMYIFQVPFHLWAARPVWRGARTGQGWRGGIRRAGGKVPARGSARCQSVTQGTRGSQE